MLTDQTAVRKHPVSFYTNLFKCEHREEQAVAQSFYTGLPLVEQHSNVALEAALSSDEPCAALQSRQIGKAPGIDPLHPDFYKSFWLVDKGGSE